jgi:hypothetical protein
VNRGASIAIGGIAILVFTVIVWGLRPWSDVQPLVTPPKVESQSATFTCDPVLGSRSAGVFAGDEPPAFPLSRNPCSQHSSRRRLAIADIGGGLLSIGVIVVVGRKRRSAPDRALEPSRAP